MNYPTPEPVVVIGAGGHAKVVISTLQAAGFSAAGVYDDDPQKYGRLVLGQPVMGPLAELETRRPRCGIIAVGNNALRQQIAQRLTWIDWVTVVHPRAFVDDSVQLGPGTVVFAGTLVQVETAVGAHVILNTGATVSHDCFIGDFSHLAPGVHVAGGVRVEEGAFLGIGSAVIPGCSVGPWTTVGAGATVVSDLPGHTIAVGTPARVRNQQGL